MLQTVFTWIWLFSGVLERHPGLRVVFSEGGAGWVPYTLERADEVFANLREVLVAGLDERADGGWRGVEDGHLVLLDDLPESAFVWPVRSSFVHHRGRAVGQWTIDDVTVSGDPADIGGAPIHIALWLEIKDRFMGKSCLSEVATCGVKNSFGLRSCARGIEDEEWMLAIETLRHMLIRLTIDNLMPPDISLAIPRSLLPSAFYNQNVLYIVLALERFERDAARRADALAHAMRQFEMMPVARRKVGAGLRDADDRPAAVELGERQAEIHVTLEVQRRHRRVARRVEPFSAAQPALPVEPATARRAHDHEPPATYHALESVRRA